MYTWPATFAAARSADALRRGARRNLLATVSHLDDPKLARVLGDALYEESADGLRSDVLATLRASYHGEELRETYERFTRIGSTASAISHATAWPRSTPPHMWPT